MTVLRLVPDEKSSRPKTRVRGSTMIVEECARMAQRLTERAEDLPPDERDIVLTLAARMNEAAGQWAAVADRRWER
jgi:hypothetical protein